MPTQFEISSSIDHFFKRVHTIIFVKDSDKIVIQYMTQGSDQDALNRAQKSAESHIKFYTENPDLI